MRAGPAVLLALAASGVLAQSVPEALTLEVFDAADADQGVAVTADAFFAVDNAVIARHSRESGDLEARWDGGEDGAIAHLNSCVAIGQRLECANSNYPATPMASSVEYFDVDTLEHVASWSLGVTDAGSLVWTDRLANGRIAGFAHYGKRGGEPFKDNAYSSVVLFDAEWRRTGGYAFPPALTERMAPYAASGGAVHANGLLYVMGHDLPEMYVLARPLSGPYLRHVATIAVEAEGQAFAFDPVEVNVVWVIDRRAGKVRRLRLPDIDVPDDVGRFRR